MENQPQLKKILGTPALVIYGLIFMVPIAPFGIYGFIAQNSYGMIALTYLIGVVAMFFTALSYSSMASAFPIAGSVYSYASHGINKKIGFLSGWLIILDYLLVPALLYIVSAIALAEITSVPSWVWLVGFIVLNTLICWRGIEFTHKMNIIFLIMQFIVLAIFIVVTLYQVANNHVGNGFSTLSFFNKGHFSIHFITAAISIAVLSFIGFDGIATLAEETNSKKNIVGKATIMALFIAGFLFVLQTWVASLAWPDYSSFTNQDTAFYDIAYLVGGSPIKVMCIVATALSWGISNALAAQTAVSRILFAMGRDKTLPVVLSKIHPRYKTPYVSILLIAVFSLVIGLIFLAHVEKLVYLINFGALSGFFIVHVSTLNYFFIKKKSKRIIRHLLVPIIGMIVIATVWWSLELQSKILGLVWLVIGIIFLYIQQRRNKEVALDLV